MQLKVRQVPPLSFFYLFLLCYSIFLTGCAAGGSSSGLNPPSGATPPVSNPPASGPPSGSEFLYFTNSGLVGLYAGNSVSVSSLNPTSGALSNFQNAVNVPAIEFGPLNMDSYQTSIFSSAGAKYIYAGGTNLDINPSTGASSYGIYGFSIPGAQGQLAPITSGGMFNPKTPFEGFTGLTMDGLGRYLYTSDSQDLREFTVGAGGALEEGPIISTSTENWTLQAADPTGKYIYAWSNDYTNGNIGLSVFTVDASTGALTEVAGSPFLVATGSSSSLVNLDAQFIGGSITFHPSGKFLYASFWNYRLPENAPTFIVDDYIYTFSIDSVTGALSAVPGPPIFLPNVSLNQIVMHPNGKFLYVSPHLTNVSSPGILMFPIDGTSGAATATPISVRTGNTYYTQLLIDPSSSGLIGIGATIDSFTINSSTGLLTAASSLTTDSGTTPGPLAFGSSVIVRVP